MQMLSLSKKNYWLFLIFFVSGYSFSLSGSENVSYCFRVYLKSKSSTPNALSTLEKVVSTETLGRRAKKGIPIDESDLPLDPSALESVLSQKVSLVTHSKWMNTVVVESRDSSVIDRLRELPVTDSVCCVWKGSNRLQSGICLGDESIFEPEEKKTSKPYGYAESQIEMLNGHRLHDNGRRGQGIRIAVIDAGFLHVDRIRAFESLQLLGTHNVVAPGNSVFCEDDHGTKVLSCLAANLPGLMVGTAPEASYLLIKSEDTRSEFPIEEDYWAAALEYADSFGVDIVTSSLGYFEFDWPEAVYSTSDLNGQSSFISQVAHKASEKGLLVFCSAGNEGNHSWEKITFPADVADVITVGAITADKERSNFSSTGLTTDYRVKPDVVALGSGVCVINSSGNIHYTNGTSFATPIVAGLSACLWQALPWLTNKEMVELIRLTSSQADRPDAELGYGIPDIYKAYKKEMNSPL